MTTNKRPQIRQSIPDNAQIAYRGFLFEVWQWDQTMYDQTTRKFELLRRPDTVIILPIMANGSALFGEEQQPGATLMLRTVGGRMEKGEEPEQSAARELLEETGYKAKEWRLWNAWQPINKIDWVVYLFVAHGLTKIEEKTIDAGENIVLKEIPCLKLLDRTYSIHLDDSEFLSQLYYARGDSNEFERVQRLLTP